MSPFIWNKSKELFDVEKIPRKVVLKTRGVVSLLRQEVFLDYYFVSNVYI